MSHPAASPPPIPMFPVGTVLRSPDTGWPCLVAVSSDLARLEDGDRPAYVLIGASARDPAAQAWPASLVEDGFRVDTSRRVAVAPASPGPSPRFPSGGFLVHRKGGRYRILLAPDRLVLWDGRPAYAYVAADARDDGRVWVRPAVNMEDGRFLSLPAAQGSRPGPGYSSRWRVLQVVPGQGNPS